MRSFADAPGPTTCATSFARRDRVRLHRGSCVPRLRRARWCTGAAVLVVATLLAAPASAATSAKDLYTQALTRERELRASGANTSSRDFQVLMNRYYRIVLLYPRSGYSDNALWQAAGLALLAFERFQDATYRRAGERYLRALKSEYPSSSLQAQVAGRFEAFEAVALAASETRDVARIRGILRQALDTGTRVVIEFDGEAPYREERLADPPRVFFDLKKTAFDPSLDPALLTVPGDIIRDIRLGKHPNQTSRVVLELTEEPRYSVFTLFDPYRLVIDFERAAGTIPSAAPTDAVKAVVRTPESVGVTPPTAAPPATAALPEPTAPSANADGQFSLARQLGLGVSRIVIDPGHGGHDPGAKRAGLTEATVALDIALRLEKLLLAQPGVEVVMTRRTNVFVPLDERTAIANREDADLFLSIHVNASRNPSASGIETYFLNFATNPEAEEVAARENSASGDTMHRLPDIVRAIALNNKQDESKDVAQMIQHALVDRVKPQHTKVRNLGVKQAPFVVLVGAQMPSVLTEVSFLTNSTEHTLLKQSSYRQRLAQGLFDAINKYQRSLKNTIVAAQQ